MQRPGGHRVHDGTCMSVRAELSSVATSLEELLSRISRIAEGLSADEREVVGTRSVRGRAGPPFRPPERQPDRGLGGRLTVLDGPGRPAAGAGFGSGQDGPCPRHGRERRRAEIRQDALGATGSPGHADPAAVQDQPEAERPPLPGGQQRVDIGLDPDRIGRLGETEQTGQAGHVGVDRQAGQVETHAPHHVGGLAPHSGQGDQVLDRLRHLARRTARRGPGPAP